MAITAQDVNKLRQMTGAGMMDCKKALTEAGGDFDTAIEILRKKGQKVSAARSDRETNEGSVFVRTSDDHKTGVIVAVGCETDFVAKNDEFQALGNAIADLAYQNKPATIEQLKALQLGDLTVADKLVEMIGKIGEKIEITAFEIVEGEKVISYIHMGAKLGVLVAMVNTGDADVSEAGRDVAMQIAAMNPVALDKDGVDQKVIQQEIEIGMDQARQEGKPEEMLERIATGKLNKFFKDNTLLSQTFVKDNSMTIQQYLDSVNKGLTVSAFKRVALG
ncbi:translation elongation factor Ts [Peijinzhouia sedimentorum]